VQRLLPLLLLAHAAGILLADRGLVGIGAARVAGALALATGLAMPRRPAARAAAALAVALAAGALAMAVRYDQAGFVPPPEGVTRTIAGRVRAAAAGPDWAHIELEDVVGVDTGVAPVSPRVAVFAGDAEEREALQRVVPGDRVRARLRLTRFRPPRNPGVPEDRRRARAGIAARGSLVHPSLLVRVGEGRGELLARLHRLRGRLGARLAALGRGGGLLRALALGDRRDLDADTRDRFARLGIAHLLAVSGLHLMLAAGLAFALARAALVRCGALPARTDVRRLALGLALLVAGGYAALAGWAVPVQRALVFLFASALAVAWTRPAALAPPLSAAALIVLADAPDALFAVGAQLSFAAAAALAVAARRAEDQRGALRRALRTTAVAAAATAPIAAVHLGRTAPFALIVNLIAVPWTALLLLPLALVALVCVVLPGLPGASPLLAVADAVADASLAAVDAASSLLPEPVARIPAPGWIAAVALLAVGAVVARTTRSSVALSASVAVVLALAPPPAIEPPPPRLVIFDVGQGDSALIQARGGAVLVDAGSRIPGVTDRGRRIVAPALRALGVDRLALVVATHADLDHRGGLPAVLDAVPVDLLWLPHGGRRDPGFAPLLAAANARGVVVQERGRGDPVLHLGDLEIEPLWPPRGPGAAENNRSLVVRAAVAGRRVLLPGDIEAAAEDALVGRGADLRADVLLLPHHGSRTSSGAAFLAAVDPRVALASAPCVGRFGMPHAEVLARLVARDIPLWWTGRDGALRIALDEGLAVHPQGAPRSCPAQVAP
jgi:competence protein ComEC